MRWSQSDDLVIVLRKGQRKLKGEEWSPIKVKMRFIKKINNNNNNIFYKQLSKKNKKIQRQLPNLKNTWKIKIQVLK
jgi:hypothetical protein